MHQLVLVLYYTHVATLAESPWSRRKERRTVHDRSYAIAQSTRSVHVHARACGEEKEEDTSFFF